MKVCFLFRSIFFLSDETSADIALHSLCNWNYGCTAELVVAFCPEVRHCFRLACLWFEDLAD